MIESEMRAGSLATLFKSPFSQHSSAAVLVLLAALVLLRCFKKTHRSKETINDLQFPPQRRFSIHSLPSYAKPTEQVDQIPQQLLVAKALPTTRTLSGHTKEALYSPTGFSTLDIKALGRFPDYAVLSGVRHPHALPPSFDLKKVSFRPFRPFRWGYHQTMALMKLDPDYWIELERNYLSTMSQRQSLLRRYPDRILFHDPGSELACHELMEMVLQFVCIRYPRYFSLESESTVFVNRLLNTRTEVSSAHPLRIVFDNIPEDFTLMLRSEVDGQYYLRAAAVCSSVGWDVAQKRGMALSEIHEPVPDYAAKMARSMDRFFARMPTDKPVQRCSWTLEDHDPLFSSPAAEPGVQWERSRFAGREQDVKVEDIHLRCDIQTLRRLPLTGAMVFNFKTAFTPLTQLKDEPKVPALLAQILTRGKHDLVAHKALPHVSDLAVRNLESWAREQVKNGNMPADWTVGTLDESPFFPGWNA